MKVYLVLACAIAMGSPAWAINKCTGPDGKVTFQEAACDASGKSEQMQVKPASGAGPSSPREAAFANAIAVGKIMIGMSASQVRRAWGSPDKINVSTGSYGRHEQWIYRGRDFRDQYVYLENGVVTSAQSPE
jgi:hypothetical protein